MHWKSWQNFARKMEPTEYAYFYRLMERMENNVEICILVIEFSFCRAYRTRTGES